MGRQAKNRQANDLARRSGEMLTDNTALNDLLVSTFQTTGKIPGGCRQYNSNRRGINYGQGRVWCTQIRVGDQPRLVAFNLTMYQAHRLYLTAKWRYGTDRMPANTINFHTPPDDIYVDYLRMWERTWGLETCVTDRTPKPLPKILVFSREDIEGLCAGIEAACQTADTLDELRARVRATMKSIV